MSSNMLRITGMATGMDTDNTVKQMMKPYTMKLDKMKQEKQLLQWKQELYRNILSDLSTFKSNYFDSLKPETNMLSESNYSSFDVAATDSITPTKTTTGATATAGVGASEGTYQIEVVELAKSALKEGAPLASTVTRDTKLSQLAGFSGDSFTFNIGYNGQNVEVTLSKDDTLNMVSQKISSATGGNVIGKYSELTRKFTIQTAATGETTTIGVDRNLSFLGFSDDAIVGNSLDAATTVDSALGDGEFTLTYGAVSKTIKLNQSGTSSNIQAANDISEATSLKTKDVTVEIKVGTTSYKINATRMAEWDGSKTKGDLINLLQNADTVGDGTGAKLSSVANLMLVGGKISIASKSVGEIPMSITVGGTNKTDGEALLGLTADTTTGTLGQDSTKTIKELITYVAKHTDNKVVASFDSTNKKFSLKDNIGQDISISAISDSAAATVNGLGLVSATALKSGAVGRDATVKITPPGAGATAETVKKSANNFAIDGISYTIQEEGTVTNLKVSSNIQKTFDKIKTFVDKYNELIDKVNGKIGEKKVSGYSPLTEDQKKEMEADAIKDWEAKAKEGLLRNDSDLSNMLLAMRTAFFDSISNAGLTLKDLGLSTSRDTTQRGKIVFDTVLGGEEKLKETIKNNSQQVADLFMKKSTISYSPNLSVDDRKTRYDNEGIIQRINDILQDYTRTTRNNDGKKGVLLEKAGVKGDFTEFNNTITSEVTKKETAINEMVRKLTERENRYYNQFAKLEQAMNKMNAQSSWLAQQLGTS